MSNKKSIAVDIDGVLLDWLSRCWEILGKDPEPTYTWEGPFIPSWMPEKVFWNDLVADPIFYEGVKPTRFGPELVNLLDRAGVDWFFATMCSPQTVGPKAAAIKRFYGPRKGVFITWELDKTEIGGYDLLIDDHPKLVGRENVISTPTTYNDAFLKEGEHPLHHLEVRMERFMERVKEEVTL